MLAKVRASHFRRLLTLCWEKKCAGSVVILEDDMLSNQMKSLDPPTVPRRGPALRLSGSQYFLPEEYSNLLDLWREGKIRKNEDEADRFTAANTDSQQTPQAEGTLIEKEELVTPEMKRAFWARARAILKQRIGKIALDEPPGKHRVAKLHESLWVEELRTNFELQQLTTSVDKLRPLGNGLYHLDLTETFDQFSHSFEQFLQRGVQIRISKDGEQVCLAFVQPGSDSGKVLVSIATKLEETRGPYTIEFLSNRFPQRAMHQALDSAPAEEVLSEEPDKEREESQNISMSLEETIRVDFEPALPAVLNSVQHRAVRAAMQSRSRMPVIVWGPPGTGKSTLAAFLIWCLVQSNSRFQILVTAPSNTGADVLCSKLAKLGLDESRMLRLNALGRNVETVPEDIQSYGRTVQKDGRTTFEIPELSQLRSFRVVVTTCICASHIANVARKEGVRQGWFSHVLVDEAGEATEPETLVPIQLASPGSGGVILLGDHFQLGPLVLSSLAKRTANLDESMIERLVNGRFQASEGSLNRDTLDVCESKGLFFLTESFRSHPDIMEIYSKVHMRYQARVKGKIRFFRVFRVILFFRTSHVESFCAKALMILNLTSLGDSPQLFNSKRAQPATPAMWALIALFLPLARSALGSKVQRGLS